MELAKGLEQETDSDTLRNKNHFVGGPIQMAVLSEGAVQVFPPENLPAPQVGHIVTLITNSQMHGFTNHLLDSDRQHSVVFANGLLESYLQRLDGTVFSQVTFRDMQLLYNGEQPTYISADSSLENCILLIGHNVPENDATYQFLVSRFHWKDVRHPPFPMQTGKRYLIPEN